VHSFLPSVHRLNWYRHGKIFFRFFVFLFVDCGAWKMHTPVRKLPTDLLVSPSGVDLKGVCYVCTNISYCWEEPMPERSTVKDLCSGDVGSRSSQMRIFSIFCVC
jgi:hypothetical protein